MLLRIHREGTKNAALSLFAVTCCWLVACGGPAKPSAEPKLQYITTAHQPGVVGYRDPLGAVSPDGSWLAVAVQQHLHIVYPNGGPIVEMPSGTGTIRRLSWLPNGKDILIEQPDSAGRWWLVDIDLAVRRPLWPFVKSIKGRKSGTSASVTVTPKELSDIAFSHDGRSIAGVRWTSEGSELWTMDLKGDSIEVRAFPDSLSQLTWSPDQRIVCVVRRGGHPRISFPCGSVPQKNGPDVYGPLAVSAGGRTLYYASPNAQGTLDLWARGLEGGVAVQITRFARDTYAPSTTEDGRVFFKTQHYRATVAMSLAAGGHAFYVATFQSETPSWDPTSRFLGVTFGSWRRFIDDAQYPDITQDIGWIDLHKSLPAAGPSEVFEASPSEDQGLGWSPNGKWIAFHSHRAGSDDLYLRPADRSAPARRITFFGRGFETGWPRWSPDGKWLVVSSNGDGSPAAREVLYLIGVDQITGAVTDSARIIPLAGYPDAAFQAEWLGTDSEHLVFEGWRAPDRHGLYLANRTGGPPRLIHQWVSEQRYSGIGSSPDGKWIAFVAPAPDGTYQIFRVSSGGGAVAQLTIDPTNKTQPSYSPDGKQLAFTVWDYAAQFWALQP